MVTLITLHVRIYFLSLILSLTSGSPFHPRNRLNAVSDPCSPTTTDMYLSSLCWILCICVALALFQAARSPGCRPASYAGNTTESTLCASHCPTPGMCWRRRVHTGSVTLLHSSLWPCQALMLAQLFLRTLYFCKFVSYAKFLGTTPAAALSRNPDAEVGPHLKLMNKSARVDS